MKTYLGILACVMMCMSACVAKAAQEQSKQAAQGNNAFAFDLYEKLASQEGNLFYSPYSIESALAMAYAGARGQTAQEMARVLRFEQEGNKLHEAMGQLHKAINGEQKQDRGFELVAANALWGQRGYPFNPAFLGLIQSSYVGGFNQVDFIHQNQQAGQTINQWVERQTHEKIKDLIGAGDLSPDARLVLTSAIYFKGAWAERFSRPMTQEEAFTTGGGKTVQARMMNQQESFRYTEMDGAQIVELPYVGGEVSMVVVLPRKADGLEKVAKELDEGKLSRMIDAARLRRVMLSLPTFKITQRVELGRTLTEMGMGTAFDAKRADFGGMCSQEPLHIAKVIHQAFVDVNEDGTEAAAATATIALAAAAVRPEAPVSFRADHPFMLVIRHRDSGAILFVGRVMDPTAR